MCVARSECQQLEKGAACRRGRSEGSQDLQPAQRDSQGEPPIPGPKNSEQEPLEQGRDILSKLNAQNNKKKNGETQLLIPESKAVEERIFILRNTPRPKEEIPAEVEDAVTPLVWASGIPGLSKLAESVKVVLKSGTKLVRQKQYPIQWEARKGLEKLTTKILNYGLLTECKSEYNTPILPVKKQNGKEYRLAQDLRAINEIVQDIHPVVANPYTLLTSLKEKHKWFTVLDLKDAFFCIPLDKDSQAYLPLNGKAPPLDTRHNSPGQCYPKGSKILAKELEVWKKENSEGIILQYVDDILIAAETQEDCLQVTISLSNFFGTSRIPSIKKQGPDWERDCDIFRL
ncbi:hypothetical protein QYF61_016332 [Mycteria americana]|uniref:ribonuclease H n=1 Tax=Mycteria americana TaxID=33587 RepID=A0AAN7NVL4_MYCAM|nr:hypothetical protein QYF61_016332 [Mycteria americana]